MALLAGKRGKMKRLGFALAVGLALWPSFAGAQVELAATVDESGRVYVAEWNPGDGAFEAFRQIGNLRGSTARGVALADFDGDGDLDALSGVPNGANAFFYILENDDGEFTNFALASWLEGVGSYVMAIRAGDLNHDGRMDFVSVGNERWVGVHLADRSGGFVARRYDYGSAGRGLDLADFDGDGHLDLVNTRYSSGYVDLRPGVGDGTFGDPIRVGDAGSDPYGVATGDFDGDGHLDIFANDGAGGAITLWRGDGRLGFADGVAIPSLDHDNHGAFDAYDYDRDGDPDVVAVNYTGRRLLYAPNNGDGTFGPRVEVAAIPSNSIGVAAVPLPSSSAATASLGPATQTTDVGVEATFDASESAGVASWRLLTGDGRVTQADGAPREIDVTYAGEGTFLARLDAVDADGRHAITSAEVVVEGAPPTIDATPVAFGEDAARGGLWQVEIDGEAVAGDDFGVVGYRWMLPALTLDFEAEGLDGWRLEEGDWARVEDAPIAGAASLCQRNVGPNRTRILYEHVFGNDLEIELDVRLVAGAGEEVQILLEGASI